MGVKMRDPGHEVALSAFCCCCFNSCCIKPTSIVFQVLLENTLKKVPAKAILVFNN